MMMGLPLVLYNAAIFFGLFFLMPVWVGYVLVSPKEREGFWEKVGWYPRAFRQKLAQKQPHQKRIWCHTVSVGEFNALRPLIDQLKERVQVVITTTTLTGQTLARKTYPDLPITYFPYDFLGILNHSLDLIQPDLTLLMETELWPNFVFATAQLHGIPLISINSRMSQGSTKGYKKVKPLMKLMFSYITHFYAQSPFDAENLMALGAPPEKITMAGNLKFDVVPTLKDERQALLYQSLGLLPHHKVVTLASTHPGEDVPLAEAALSLQQQFPTLVVILAPRHPERTLDIERLLNEAGITQHQRRTDLTPGSPRTAPLVILNTIGELQSLFGFSRVAVIAGSFEAIGGHNPLEALVENCPVVFGRRMSNFKHIAKLTVEAGAGTVIAKYADLAHILPPILQDDTIHRQMVQAGKALLAENQGAKQRLIQAIERLLVEPPPS